MALETLKEVKEIGGYDFIQTHEGERLLGFDKDCYIYVNHNTNSICFVLQNGPIKEVGKNGVQVDTLIEAAKLIIEGLNKNYPCRENSMVITKLDEALLWSMKRKLDREARGVEGLNKR